MKRIILLFVITINAFTVKGQNLVPNGDFEQYSPCPTAQAQIDYATPWTNPVIWSGGGLQSDYFNQCSTGSGGVGVPNNNLGYQPAHSGNGYSGFYLYASFWSNLREYIMAPLTSPLTAGACYHFEMYAALSDNSQYTTDDLAAHFSDTVMNGITNYFPLPVVPQIINTGVFPDSSNWTLISGNFTASGGESYIIIGNFKDDASTTLVDVNSSGSDMTMIAIDDVSLTLCTGVEEHNEDGEIKIYPNPCREYLVISNSYGLKEKIKITVTDILGKEIYQEEIKTSNVNADNYRIQTSNYKPGIYFIEIKGRENVFRKKFIKE